MDKVQQGGSRMSDLASRAVACKHWRWLPGMHDSETGLRPLSWSDDWEGEVPDLTDPATLGCLLALVREVNADPSIHIRPTVDGKWWVVYRRLNGRVDSLGSCFKSEADALVWLLGAAE